MRCEILLLGVFVVRFWSGLMLLRCRRLALLRLRRRRARLLRGRLALLKLRSRLALLGRSRLALLRLRDRLAWLNCRLALLLLRRSFTLLRSRLALLLRRSLTLLRLRSRLALLRRSLALLRLRSRLALRHGLTLLRLRSCPTLFRLRNRLALLRTSLTLLRLRSNLTLLLLLGNRLALLLLLYRPIGLPQRRRSTHIAIRGERLSNRHIRRAATIGTGELGPIGPGSTLILHLSLHRRSVRLAHCNQFRRPGRRPHTTRSSAEAHAGVVGVASHRAAIDVAHHGGVYVVD